eukprot:gene16613-18946_t
MTTRNTTNAVMNHTEIAKDIPADATAIELEAILNAVPTIGTVSVTRRTTVVGFQWLVTFDGCKIVNGMDVCNLGDVVMLGVDNSQMTCGDGTAHNPVVVNEVVPGSGPSTDCTDDEGNTDLCIGYVTDLTTPAPYTYQISGLTTGTPYYVRVTGHNSIGYGVPALTSPAFQVPSFNPPGAPPPVRLVSSTATSVNVEWDYPRENGGMEVEGFQVWADNWDGGAPFLVYDGIDQANQLSAVIASLTTGKTYRFTVRAINHCLSSDPLKACFSEFSTPAAFTVRAPQAPVAPSKPYRHASTNIGGIGPGDATVSIRWLVPLDNGGAPITGYTVYYATEGESSYHSIPLNYLPIINPENGKRVLEYNIRHLNESSVYRFYVTARNSIGASPASPVLSMLVGMLPGVDSGRNNTFATAAPTITAVSDSEITVAWPMPALASFGGIPVTGYLLYRYAGVGLNTNANPQTVFNEVQQIQTSLFVNSTSRRKLTEVDSLTGSFSLTFNGERTVDLACNISSVELKAALEDLPGIGTVTVSRLTNFVDGANFNAYTWFVTFDSTPGDVPMLYATPGRLGPVSKRAGITVSEILKGTVAELVYDGSDSPDVRSVTIGDLIEDQTYAFKVVPINALGAGVLSKASPTVVASSSAQPYFTTAYGATLGVGATGSIDEEQIITATGCVGKPMSIRFGSVTRNFTTAMSKEVFELLLEDELLTGVVDTTHTVSTVNSVQTDTWLVIFKGTGNVALLTVASYSAGCSVNSEEFIAGSANLFTIAPRTGDGTVLRDTTSSTGFAGQDIFLTETFDAAGNWVGDHGVATYNPQVYEIQMITIPVGSLNAPVVMSMDDYLTPDSQAVFLSTAFTAHSTAFEVQQALQTLPNIDSVDVQRVVNIDSSVSYLVTFLRNLGNVPSFTSTNAAVTVSEVVSGTSEVQTINIAGEAQFVREVKMFLLPTGAQTLQLTMFDSPEITTLSAPITAAKVEAALEAYFGPNGAPVEVRVTVDVVASGSIISITFISPVGDVGDMPVSYSTDGSTYSALSVTEVTKGYSPIGGIFTLFFENVYTDPLPFDASAAQVKEALEKLPTINKVLVYREDTNNGFKWTASFTEDVGNQPMIEANGKTFEIQRIWTTGGVPTPLSGQIAISYDGSTALVDYDCSVLEMATALESIAGIGDLEISRDTIAESQYSWLITFRNGTTEIPLLTVSNEFMFGSNADVHVEMVSSLNPKSLTGANPTLVVYEKEAGKPDYTAKYTVAAAGNYTTRITQLVGGGLTAKYYNNQLFSGDPVLTRIDPNINFDWSTGLITPDSGDFVSVEWSGKFKVDKSEYYTFYLSADDSVQLFFNHTLVIDGTDTCCVERQVSVLLEAGVYYDFLLKYAEYTGTASVNLKFSSSSTRKQVIPPSFFYSGTPIRNSPYTTVVMPSAGVLAGNSEPSGAGLATGSAGSPSTFLIQTKDANGNNLTSNYQDVDPTALLSGTVTDGTTTYYVTYTYLGNGLFQGSFTPMKAGNYTVVLKMGDSILGCKTTVCPPFNLVVSPGPTVPSVSEVETPSNELMDYLVEAVSGEYGILYIQAKDAFGNNQIYGGEPFKATFTLKSDPSITFPGIVDDLGNGKYVVRYTIPKSGVYDVAITLDSAFNFPEQIKSCTAASPPFVFNRSYDGVDAYVSPVFCSTSHPTLTVVHADLSAAHTTYNDLPDETLAFAQVGKTNSFTILARDMFGNLRTGASTTHFSGYGNGNSDYFLVEFTQPETSDYYRRSSAIDYITVKNLPNGLTGNFRLSFGDR